MKVELAFVFFGALVYIYTARSETCDGTSLHGCTVTQCYNGTAECVDIMGTLLCTCMMTHQNVNYTCIGKRDCSKYSAFANTCNETLTHCVDQTCRCQASWNHPGHGHGHGHVDHGLHLGNEGH